MASPRASLYVSGLGFNKLKLGFCVVNLCCGNLKLLELKNERFYGCNDMEGHRVDCVGVRGCRQLRF